MKNKKWILLSAIMLIMAHAYTETNRISARESHSAIYDSENKQMLIFGGRGGAGLLSDLWAYDIEKKKWEEIGEVDEAPSARYHHSAIYDSANKQMLIFGGFDQGGELSDLWAYDTKKKKWEEIQTDDAPPARCSQSAIYDSVNKQMIIFGGTGKQGVLLSDLWVFDIEKKTWEEIEADETPPARCYHSAIYDSVNKQMIIWGGYNQMLPGPCFDLWAYGIEKKKWEEIEIDEAPPARYCHRAVYDSTNKQLLIFGGDGRGRFLSDLWAYDIEKKIWKEIKTNKRPSVRYEHSAIYDSTNKQIFVFGGNGGAGPLSDLWAFDTEKKTWQKLKPKSDKD